MIAAVRIRGSVNVVPDIAHALVSLRLFRVNNCVLMPSKPENEGMLKKARPYITWGEIDRETLEKLIAKRGRLEGEARVPEQKVKDFADRILKSGTVEGTGLKPVFRLSPPSKGYRSVRLPYPKGDHGSRAGAINELIKRMI
jgi:large subunit ribosomal protein L30